MTETSNIPLVRASNGEVLPGKPSSQIVLSSALSNWRHLVLEEHHHRSCELAGFMYKQHVIVMNVGKPVALEFKTNGTFQRVTFDPTFIDVIPAYRPFFRRSMLDDDRSADVLYVALDPIFLQHTAEALDLDPDRVELVEQIRYSNPALRHIALAPTFPNRGRSAVSSSLQPVRPPAR